MEKGISMIHQELHPIPHMSIMENLWLGRYTTNKFKLLNNAKMYKDTKELLKIINFDLDPNILMGTLSVSDIQLIEIAKAVSYNAKVIIMDEPTSSLTLSETETLFNIINSLKSRGISIIYISHKIEEVLEISDNITVMKDGETVGSWPADKLNPDMIISKMVGRTMEKRFPKRDSNIGDILLRVENLTSIDPSSFKDVSFELRKGEILGLGGLIGSKRTELLESIFGLRKIKSGNIYINGDKVEIKNPYEAKIHKMALLTEERRTTGIFPVLSILDNISIANIKNYTKMLLNLKKRKEETRQISEKLSIKTPTLQTMIKYLSGGNQQKTIFARWLLTNPDILLLDEPTRGIDVGAKYEIYLMISDLAAQGKAVIMISSEMVELLGITDRIMVMCEGKQAGFLNKHEMSEINIMKLSTKFMVGEKN